MKWRRASAGFRLEAFRGLRALPDRPNCWQVLAAQPELDVRFPQGIPTTGWAVLFFDLYAEGGELDRCWVSSLTRMGRRSTELSRAGRHGAVVRLSRDLGSIRIRFNTKSRLISLVPVSIRYIGRTEAGLRMLMTLLRVHARNWLWLRKLGRVILDVCEGQGSRALAKWLLDQYFVRDVLDAQLQFEPTSLSLFDDDDIAKACGLMAEKFIWNRQSPSEIKDIWSAARFCIDTLRTHAHIRKQFPNALSAGPSGAFGQWIQSGGADLFSLSAVARNAIQQALGAGLSNDVRQMYLVREDLQRAFPLALTPAGRREFFSWILDASGLRLETIWWFFLECDENPARELVQTFLFRPEWQRTVPDGVTIFGRAKLASWLAQAYGLNADWVNPTLWPVIGTAAEQIRLAYAVRQEWQLAHPSPFRTILTAEAFLDWLTSPAAGLSEDCLAWCRSLDQRAVAESLAADGVNILGYFGYTSGLRRSVESITQSIRSCGLGVSLRNIWQDSGDEPRHAEFRGLEFYDTTIIHIQPQAYFDVSYERAGLHPRNPQTYRIGYWYWEIEDLPEPWIAHAAQLDELWVATEFISNAARQRLDVPVFHMMPGIELPRFAKRPRADLGLPEHKFIFLFVFSMMSVMERKNPLGLIQAYRKAFGSDNRTLLVIKTTFGDAHPHLLTQLHAVAAADSGVLIIDAVYSQEDILSLISAADCYVSLHRSEGWGLTMAEAMLLGKPTIATGYSGNMDFMKSTNSLLVDYNLVPLERNYPPYTKGSRWANPSVAHAAQLMRRVFENQRWARELGARAQADLEGQMSIAASGRRMAVRLKELDGIRANQSAIRRGYGRTRPLSTALTPDGTDLARTNIVIQ